MVARMTPARPRKRILALVAGACVALALGLAACGGGDEDVQATAEADLCSALGTLSASITGLQGMPATSEKSEIQFQVGVVQNNWQSVQQDFSDLKEADKAALESAASDLQQAVEDLPEDTTFADALQQLEPELAAVHQAFAQMWNGLGCADSGASTTAS
jgi:hypothetical protein